jgi:hypothetical protein
VVGTLGYIALELIQTWKATPSSDVFNFGVLLLEVACRTMPVDPSKGSERMILVECAWELYTEGTLLEALDPKLEKAYDVGEMEKVLKLGLLCSAGLQIQNANLNGHRSLAPFTKFKIQTSRMYKLSHSNL